MNVEQEYLDFIRSNLENVRIESYKDIQETILRGHVNGSSTRKIILSSSLTDEHYKPEDQSDIIARVFQYNLNDMISFIESWKPFGKTVVDVCVVEIQKRGLPHTHLLIWLASEYKFQTLDDVDSIISAKLLDKTDDPFCFEIVSKFMLQGPCGIASPKAQSMKMF
uniref:Helitron helicase-like domain-containing protein n=1 Tax=Salix viminalis TaxID=40686 RepID=A0A6N2K468_SALVM